MIALGVVVAMLIICWSITTMSHEFRLRKIERWIEKHDFQQNILMLMPGAQVGSMTSPGELGKLLGGKDKP